MIKRHRGNDSCRCWNTKVEDGICAQALRSRVSNLKKLVKELERLVRKGEVPMGFKYCGFETPAAFLPFLRERLAYLEASVG